MLFFDLLYFLAFVAALPLWVKFFFKKQYRTILKHRLTPDIEHTDKKRIWIHAVSVGEVRSLKHLIENLNGNSNDNSNGNKPEIVLSVTTPSGYEFAKQQYKSIKIINAPVDFSFTVKKFIKKINPKILILNELEMWPNWLMLIKRKHIPALLINGRISDTAFKRYKRFNFFLKVFFNKIDRFLVQTEIHGERFRELGIPAEKINVCGNIKADEAFNAAEHLPPDTEIVKELGIREKTGKRKILTIASSHLADELLTTPLIRQLSDRYFFIFVPRHLTRVEEIEKLLEKHGVTYSTWSKQNRDKDTEENGGNESVLIFDRMGYLFNVLKITDIVFMGGTLEPKIGGHNLYEPAALGKIIVGGPCYNNFPAIGAELVQKGVYHVINDSQELSDFLSGVDGKIDFKHVEHEALNAVSAKRGSIGCILKEIRQSIK